MASVYSFNALDRMGFEANPLMRVSASLRQSWFSSGRTMPRVPCAPAVFERRPRKLTAIGFRLRSVLKVRNSKHRQAGVYITNHAPVK